MTSTYRKPLVIYFVYCLLFVFHVIIVINYYNSLASTFLELFNHCTRIGNASNGMSIRSGDSCLESLTTNKETLQPNFSAPTCHAMLSMHFSPFTGLGNKMWLYASAFGIAKRNGFKLMLPTDIQMTSAFKFNETHLVDDNAMASTDWLIIDDAIVNNSACCYWMTFHEDFYNLSALQCRNIRLHGYFQSWRYFVDFDSDVRRHFTFSETIKQKAQKYLHGVLRSWTSKYCRGCRKKIDQVDQPVFVGTHIRLGDWRYDSLSALSRYLQQAIEYFTLRFRHVVFVICSNDLRRSRKLFNMERLLTTNHSFAYVSSRHNVIDMALLASCNHSIITAGTYGWWAAYLAGGKTVYFQSKQNKLGTSSVKSNVSHYFFPGWIPLPQ